MTQTFSRQMRERKDQLQREGEADSGPDPGPWPLRRQDPALGHQRHW